VQIYKEILIWRKGLIYLIDGGIDTIFLGFIPEVLKLNDLQTL